MSSSAVLFADVIEKLKATVQEGRTFDAAQIKIVGLENIRVAAGENWDAIKERVRANSLTFLQGCLAPSDIVIPAGDGFLVLYSDTSSRDLMRECAALQDALNAFYIGEDGMEELRAKVKGIAVDAVSMHAALSGSEPAETIVHRTSAGKPQPQAPAGALCVGSHHLVFAPVWSVAQEAIATYFVTAVYFDHGGAHEIWSRPPLSHRCEALGPDIP